MNAVTIFPTGFEQSLSRSKETQMTGNKNTITAPGIQCKDFFYALLRHAAFNLVKTSHFHTTA